MCVLLLDNLQISSGQPYTPGGINYLSTLGSRRLALNLYVLEMQNLFQAEKTTHTHIHTHKNKKKQK